MYIKYTFAISGHLKFGLIRGMVLIGKDLIRGGLLYIINCNIFFFKTVGMETIIMTKTIKCLNYFFYFVVDLRLVIG